MDSWNFFIVQCSSNSKISKLQKLEWPQIWEKKLSEISTINNSWRCWLNHLADVGLKNFYFIKENLKQIKFCLTMDSTIFWIEFIKSENYPITLPKWNCNYYSLFLQFFQNQKAECGLFVGSDVDENYIKQLFCVFKKFSLDLNNVFREIKNLNSSEFELIVKNNDNIFEFDEVDLNLIIVRIRLKNFFDNLTIILYLDVNYIFAYPNRILTEPMLPELLQKINPSKWDLERHLYDNFLVLFDDFLSK